MEKNSDIHGLYIVLYMWGDYFMPILTHKVGENLQSKVINV